MVNQLAELVRIRFLSEIAKTARTPNGTYDLAKARAQVKKTYREIALLAHPDRNPGDKYQEELFKQMGAMYGEIEKASDQQIIEYLTQATQPEFGGAGQELQALVAQAADAVENLAYQKAELEQRLARTQADIVSLRRGGQYHPDQIEIYIDQPRGIRITLANANQEIPRLIDNGGLNPNTILYENKAHGLRITAGNAQTEIKKLDDKVQWQHQQIMKAQQDAQLYLDQRNGYKAQCATLETTIQQAQTQAKETQTILQSTQQQLQQEKEARTALEKKTITLDQLLKDTNDAATKLMTTQLADQKRRYENILRGYQTIVEQLDPSTNQQNTATQNQPTTQNQTLPLQIQYRLFTYAADTFNNSQKKTTNLKDAKDTLLELLKMNPEEFAIPSYHLAKQLLDEQKTNSAEYVAITLLSVEPKNPYIWHIMAQSVEQSPTANRPDRKAWQEECSQNAQKYQPYTASTLIGAVATLNNPQSLRDYSQIKAAKATLTTLLQLPSSPTLIEQLKKEVQHLYQSSQYELAEETALAITAALPNRKDIWQLAADSINASKSSSRPERQQWAQQCYAHAK